MLALYRSFSGGVTWDGAVGSRSVSVDIASLQNSYMETSWISTFYVWETFQKYGNFWVISNSIMHFASACPAFWKIHHLDPWNHLCRKQLDGSAIILPASWPYLIAIYWGNLHYNSCSRLPFTSWSVYLETPAFWNTVISKSYQSGAFCWTTVPAHNKAAYGLRKAVKRVQFPLWNL